MTYSEAGNVLGNLTYAGARPERSRRDQDGRRIQESGSWARMGVPNPTTSTAVYNAGNELTVWNGATLAGASPERSRSDANMTVSDARSASRMELRDGTNTYTWDARNQLNSISGILTASFEYAQFASRTLLRDDPFGRRLQKTINSATTGFLYDGVNPVQELSGTTVTANLLTGLGVDEYFTRTDSTGTSNFLTDALESAIAIADSRGVVQTQYTYDPFSATTVQSTASANSYEFPGRENAESAMMNRSHDAAWQLTAMSDEALRTPTYPHDIARRQFRTNRSACGSNE